MKISTAALLSITGGYVDTAGFLALKGLFTAHVTGNFVTLGAALVLGSAGTIGKLLALPVFCIVVMGTRLLGYRLKGTPDTVLRKMLVLQAVLLAIAGGLAVWLGPFSDVDATPALITGMVLVAGMAIQNTAHRAYLSNEPPSTIMTSTTTQIMIDIADLLHRRPASARPSHLAPLITNVVLFALGSASAALLYAAAHVWSLALPPVLVLLALIPRNATPAGAAH